MSPDFMKRFPTPLKLLRMLVACQIPMRYWFSLKFPHPVGVVISDRAEIGDGTMIYQNVTVGGKKYGTDEYPSIGERCILYAGCIVAGAVRLPAGTVIPANKRVVGIYDD